MASSFLPAKKNLPIWQESTFRYQFEWKDDDGKSVKPHDLTGYTGRAILKGDDGSELELTTENGGIHFGGISDEPTNGLVEIYLTKAQTEALTWKKRASFTLKVVEPNPPNDDFPLLTGRFFLAGPPR